MGNFCILRETINNTDMDSEKTLYDHFCDDDVYEYVRFLAVTYYPDYEDEPDIYDAELPPVDVLANALSNTETHEPVEPVIVGCERGFRIFQRIQSGKAEFDFTKDEYDSFPDILDSVKAIGLDVEKFWYAILFIHHMAQLENCNCMLALPSKHDIVNDLVSALREERTTVNINIKRPGENKYSVETSAFGYIATFLEYCDHLYTELNNPTYTGRRIMPAKEGVSQGFKWRVFDEYNAFRKVFSKFCTDGSLPKRAKGMKVSRDKDLLISRIVYMTGLTDDESYWNSKDRLHAIKDYCRKNRRPQMSSGLIW